MKSIPLSIFALALGLLAGCSGSQDEKKPTPANTGTATGTNTMGDAEEPAPHGGTLFATKDHKIHLELVTKDDPVYLYVYDGKVSKLVPTAGKSFELTIKGGDKPTKIEFKPDRHDKDPEGQASRFSAPKKDFPKNVDYKNVEISGEVNGKPYHFLLD